MQIRVCRTKLIYRAILAITYDVANEEREISFHNFSLMGLQASKFCEFDVKFTFMHMKATKTAHFPANCKKY